MRKGQNNAGGTELGRKTKLFTNAQKEFNRELSKKLKLGSKTYINKLDCIAVYRAWNGRCAWCGLPLSVRGDKVNAVHFMLRVPTDAGGKIKRDNLITACYACKYEDHRPIPRYGFDRIYNFNTLPDLIEQLQLKTCEKVRLGEAKKVERDPAVRGELDKQQEAVIAAATLLKRQIDNAMAEFVYTLHYNPITTYEIDHPVPVDKESTVGYAVGKIAEKLAEEEPDVADEKEVIADNLQQINQTKKYRILRKE